MKPFFDAPAVITAAVTLLLSACALAPRAERQARITPPTDCKAWVGVDRNAELPGYRITQANGRAACVPLLLTAHRPPPDYRGDYAVDEFTDEKLKARWLSCKVDAACRARIEKDMQRWLPPNKARATRVTGWVDPVGKIDPDGPVDLRDIRRPAFFARAPYLESIAQADARTSVVEFTVPHDPLEINRLGMTGDIKLRGWYTEGLGVPDANGVRKRALVIASAGGGDQITAIQDPSDVAVTVDPATGRARFQRFPNATTEGFGMRTWREHLDALNRAGFDVLAYDRRGEGLSGGFSDTNTLEQSEDIFRVLEQMENGAGMRLLTASGEELEGAAARGRLMAGMKAREIPLLLLGYSRGSMTTGWAMTKNYAGGCSYDMPTVVCSPARHFDNIKGALLYSPFTAGAAYLPDAPDLADRNLFLGGMAAENYVQFYPNSAVLAYMDRWPAAFFAKGLWDRAESLEGTVAAYDRIRGLKEIEVVRGPHQMSIWPKTENDRIRDRMVSFAVAAVNDQKTLPVPGASWSDLRELVATTPDIWETSSQPR